MRYIDQMSETKIHTRVAALREELTKQGLDGFLVPLADEYQNEYPPPRSERLTWISGFDGSAGIAVILANTAVLISDGRYTVQMKAQVPTDIYELGNISPNQEGMPTVQPHEWLKDNTAAGAKIGYDPWLHTESSIKRYEDSNCDLVACDINPLDTVWEDQPDWPNTDVLPHDLSHAGKPSEEKRTEIGDALEKQGYDSVVLTAADSIAWLLNVRATDTPCTPFALSYAIAHKDGTVDWFIDEGRLSGDLHLGDAVKIHSPDTFRDTLKNLTGTILVDPTSTPIAVKQHLTGATVKAGDDPCQLPKACKNEAEQDGARSAHIRDGAAVTRFLKRIADGEARDELQAVEILREEREKEENFRDISFDPITGAGANGAIIHYRATGETNAAIAPDMLFLVDSGGQYLDGTTDITRTVAIGTPTQEQKENFTRVLKGYINLARIRFPEGTTGGHLDVLARAALWDAGLDYAHGTGHGVGSYLSVHEGPQNISGRSNVPLKPGMIISNEPGYYKEGEYGIRIESLVLVREDNRTPGFLFFETITIAPIDRNLIVPEMLTTEERDWLNSYHARVYETLSTKLDDDVAQWLKEVTAPL